MRLVSPLLIVSLLVLSGACAPEGSSAYVSRNVPLNASCQPVEDGVGIATGMYDVGSSSSPERCVHSYTMSLFINSNLKANAREATGRAEPNVLLITHADVRLMDSGEQTLDFGDAAYPNPYRVQTAAALNPTTNDMPQTGIVQIEAIPKVYAKRFASNQFDGKSVLVEVQLAGTTTGDVDVEFRPFLYPLVICRGCLSFCLVKDLGSAATRINALTGDNCSDNGAQDDRACIDPDC
jgi:hypothetical protein